MDADVDAATATTTDSRSTNGQFKILHLTFKSLNGCAPEYLCDMLNVYMTTI